MTLPNVIPSSPCRVIRPKTEIPRTGPSRIDDFNRLSASARYQLLTNSIIHPVATKLTSEYLRNSLSLSPTEFLVRKGFQILDPFEIPPEVIHFYDEYLALQETLVKEVQDFEAEFIRSTDALEQALIRDHPDDSVKDRKRQLPLAEPFVAAANELYSSTFHSPKLSRSSESDDDDDEENSQPQQVKHNGRFQPWVRNALQDWYNKKKAQGTRYATREEKDELCRRLKLTMTQVTNWISNHRNRDPDKPPKSQNRRLAASSKQQQSVLGTGIPTAPQPSPKPPKPSLPGMPAPLQPPVAPLPPPPLLPYYDPMWMQRMPNVVSYSYPIPYLAAPSLPQAMHPSMDDDELGETPSSRGPN
ncbi:hypothetical protein PAPYR_8204 [Paratrimastix pyriformis]|uniref:Homeobox domain-containing protein n=1 Tax=Paratrimastix pyriformis TaxID=342808 RepID=A0ABQ8UFT7_9EUKA|nr:hypothetical protein PAPYR_8204 [Paratrimastix pyriformis]